MAEADATFYIQKEGNSLAKNDFVEVNVSGDARSVHGIIIDKGTNEEGNEVDGTWNLALPGWDTLHGTKDENGKPQGGHIYDVRPIACTVPEADLKHARIPKFINVFSEGPKADRINGDYEYAGVFTEDDSVRPMWEKKGKDEDEPTVVMVHKKQKGKPAWIITKKEILEKKLDGGYALFAQDLWLPTHKQFHLRGEVWGIWDPSKSRWAADQSLVVTDGKGK